MTLRPASAQRQFTGRHMLFLMLAFFGVIIAVNLLMAIVATGSWTGLVVPNSYVASQQYNAKLQAAREQAALGWTSRLQHSQGKLAIVIADAAGAPLTHLTVVADISVPAHEHSNQQITLRPTVADGYVSTVDLVPGQWQADVLATSPAGETYRQVFRFIVKPEG